MNKCEVDGCVDKDLIIVCHNHINSEYSCVACEKNKERIEWLKEKICWLGASFTGEEMIVFYKKDFDEAFSDVCESQEGIKPSLYNNDDSSSSLDRKKKYKECEE